MSLPIGTAMICVRSWRPPDAMIVATVAQVKRVPGPGGIEMNAPPDTYVAIVHSWPRKEGVDLDAWVESPLVRTIEEAEDWLGSFLIRWVGVRWPDADSDEEMESTKS